MPVRAVQFGEQLFRDPRLSESSFNAFACATCHPVTPAADPSSLPPGYSLYNATARPSWWGGYSAKLLDAVNFCYLYFMRGLRPLSKDDPRSRALYEYLASISSVQSEPALPLTIARDVVDVPRGSTARGAEVYRGACQVCHGEPYSARGRISEDAPDLPGITRSYPSDFPGFPPALVVIEKVRHGQFFGVGGNMPLFSREALSDEDLGALLAFLGL